jgi:hypothetical protein
VGGSARIADAPGRGARLIVELPGGSGAAPPAAERASLEPAGIEKG